MISPRGPIIGLFLSIWLHLYFCNAEQRKCFENNNTQQEGCFPVYLGSLATTCVCMIGWPFVLGLFVLYEVNRIGFRFLFSISRNPENKVI